MSNYCKTITNRYSPYVSGLYPQGGLFYWKGYYLSNDRTRYQGVSFESSRNLSRDDQEQRLNKYLIKLYKAAPLRYTWPTVTVNTFTTYTIG